MEPSRSRTTSIVDGAPLTVKILDFEECALLYARLKSNVPLKQLKVACDVSKVTIVPIKSKIGPAVDGGSSSGAKERAIMCRGNAEREVEYKVEHSVSTGTTIQQHTAINMASRYPVQFSCGVTLPLLPLSLSFSHNVREKKETIDKLVAEVNTHTEMCSAPHKIRLEEGMVGTFTQQLHTKNVHYTYETENAISGTITIKNTGRFYDSKTYEGTPAVKEVIEALKRADANAITDSDEDKTRLVQLQTVLQHARGTGANEQLTFTISGVLLEKNFLLDVDFTTHSADNEVEKLRETIQQLRETNQRQQETNQRQQETIDKLQKENNELRGSLAGGDRPTFATAILLLLFVLFSGAPLM